MAVETRMLQPRDMDVGSVQYGGKRYGIQTAHGEGTGDVSIIAAPGEGSKIVVLDCRRYLSNAAGTPNNQGYYADDPENATPPVQHTCSSSFTNNTAPYHYEGPFVCAENIDFGWFASGAGVAQGHLVRYIVVPA